MSENCCQGDYSKRAFSHADPLCDKHRNTPLESVEHAHRNADPFAGSVGNIGGSNVAAPVLSNVLTFEQPSQDQTGGDRAKKVGKTGNSESTHVYGPARSVPLLLIAPIYRTGEISDMTTLGEYLASATGTFTSPNHPVPVSGSEMAATLGNGDVTIPGHSAYDLNLLDMHIDAVKQPSADVWLYPAERDLDAGEGPFLIHHPSAEGNQTS